MVEGEELRQLFDPGKCFEREEKIVKEYVGRNFFFPILQYNYVSHCFDLDSYCFSSFYWAIAYPIVYFSVS